MRREGRACTEVLVVGGGVIGLASAWRLARDGRTVTVADPRPGRGASWVAAGMLAPVSEAHFGEEPLVELLVAGAARWSGFAAQLERASGRSVGLRRCGTVAVALDRSDRSVVDEHLDFQRSLGLEVRRLTASQCRAVVPSLAPSVAGGGEIPGDHQVDNRRLLSALVEACARAGVTHVPQRVTVVLRDEAGAVTGARTEAGTTLAADTVVLATGWQCPEVAGMRPDELPAVRPVKGHILRLRGPASSPLLERTVRGLVKGRPCYLVPRHDGSVVVGATSEERGPALGVTAGAVHDLLHDARLLVPGLDELELEESSVGVRPGSPDNAPFVGPVGVEGLVVATGHYRNGILLAPITAEAVVAAVRGGALPEGLARFDPLRFARADGPEPVGVGGTSGTGGRSDPSGPSDTGGPNGARGAGRFPAPGGTSGGSGPVGVAP